MSKYMTPEQARKYLERYADEEIPDRIAHRALEALAADTIEYGMEYTFSEGAVETYWPHPSAATVDQVKVLDDVFGVPPRIATMHEGETITRKRFMARRGSAPWEAPMSKQRWAVMSSMIGSWGVARPEHAYRDDGLLACIEWESLHDTWTEAMQEADRMSRTATVTLPRLAPEEWKTGETP